MPFCRQHHGFVETITRRLDAVKLPYEEALLARRLLFSEYQDATRTMLMELVHEGH